jgi:hypothetical protein
VSNFSRNIRPHVDAELELAAQAQARGQAVEAFGHLERAHVLGQGSTLQHVRAHWHMFVWGWRQRSLRECAGQTVRIVGAATKTAFGLVPPGNTGGTNVSPFRPLPIAPELAVLIQRAQSRTN